MAFVNIRDYDRYGFKIETQHVSRPAWDRVNIDTLANEKKQAEKWDSMVMSNRGHLPAKSDKVKKLCRQGVPLTIRRKVWLKYSGAQARIVANPGVYLACLLREQQAHDRGIRPANEFIDVIERDLNRTFPDNIYFSSTPIPNLPPPPFVSGSTGPLIGSMRRVLVAFSFFNPEIGYCQSLNYIVGLLLLFMSEEEAFWMLVVITEDLLPHGMYNKTLVGTITEMRVFSEIVADKSRPLWKKVKEGNTIELDMLISPWFLTIYINILPIECVVRIWDAFFYEGHKILYRIALAILKIIEDDVLRLKDPMEVIQYIQNAPKRMVDIEKIMKVAFQRFGFQAVGHLSHHDIDRMRQKEISNLIVTSDQSSGKSTYDSSR